MSTRNDITGDELTTGAVTDKYREGWKRIFDKKPVIPRSLDFICLGTLLYQPSPEELREAVDTFREYGKAMVLSLPYTVFSIPVPEVPHTYEVESYRHISAQEKQYIIKMLELAEAEPLGAVVAIPHGIVVHLHITPKE